MTATDPQEKIFSFLLDPRTHAGAAVKRIDTHAASVFLAGERAYKVKRAVRFPFLDYSTLEKRKAACFRELEVNRRFAPRLYLKVGKITAKPGGGFAIDGSGDPVEWVVVMQRFDEQATLDCLAERGSIDDALAEQLGRMVAKLHAAAPAFDFGRWLRFLPGIIDDNDAAFRQRADLFGPGRIDFLRDRSKSILARIQPLLERRGSLGFIREGHGDLHLGNIVLIDGVAVPFDAIEFDPLIAAGDVFYDLAFLLMDLVDRGLAAKANIVLNRYLIEARRNENLDGLAALPLFLSLRAAIRAKVTVARLLQVAPENPPALVERIRTYFHYADDFLSPPPPRLIAVGGLSGTGKSALARRLAPRLAPAPGAVVLRSDIERKLMFGVPEGQPLPGDAYRPEVSARVYGSLCQKAGGVLSAGHSAIADAVFASPQERHSIKAVADACNAPFVGLFLETDLKTRLDRVGRRVKDASDADAAVAARQESFSVGSLDWIRVDASGDLEATLVKAVKAAGL